MIKRIIDISEQAYLHLENRQLLVDRGGETIASAPVEDLGILILQDPAIVISQALVVACQENNVALVFCDAKHLPYSVVLPVSDAHSLHNKVLRQQVEIKPTTKKRLWKEIVQYKIRHQAQTLDTLDKNSKPLERMINKVKSGDAENHEAQAARQYWRILMGPDFRRDVEEEGVNALLNYGYSIVRAMVARAIVASGLHPALGIHHRNQYNGLCLADDLMEPLRPWVDRVVFRITETQSDVSIDQENKKQLLGLLSTQVRWEGNSLPLMVAFHQFMANLKRAYVDNTVRLKYPTLERQLHL